MATRADFTDEEWKALQAGLTGAGMYVATSDPGFFDNFREANALAKHLRDVHEHAESVLIRDIASGHERPFGMTASPAEIEEATMSAIGQGIAALEAKAPEEVPAYREAVLEVAQSVAAAAKGVSEKENAALEKLKAAVGG
jgi:hypothetical protein